MTFVLDASVVISRFLPDEGGAVPFSVFDLLASERPLVTQNMALEVVTGLLRAHRNRRLSAERLEESLQALGALLDNANVDTETTGRAWNVTAALARHHQLSAYDAAYLWLAADLKCPLATFDERLADAAQAHLSGLD